MDASACLAEPPRLPNEELHRVLHLHGSHSALLGLLRDQEKRKQLTPAQIEECLPVLLAFLEQPKNPAVVRDVVLALKEIVTEKEMGKGWCRALVQRNGCQPLLCLLSRHREMGLVEPGFVAPLYMLLSKLASKDRKFALKARLLGALKAPLEELRRFKVKPSVRRASLLLLKRMLVNKVNGSLLGSEGLLLELLRLLENNSSACQQTALVLECLAWATRSKRNVLEMAQRRSLEPLLQLLSSCDWKTARQETLWRRICRADLECLLNIANYKMGSRWLNSGGVPRALCDWCARLPPGSSWDRLALMACLGVQRCLPLLPLPLPTLDSPLGKRNPSRGPPDETPEAEDPSSSEQESDSDHEVSKCPPVKCSSAPDLQAYAKFFPELRSYGMGGFLSRILSEMDQDLTSVGSALPKTDKRELYQEVAQSTHSLAPFVKLAYPDLQGHKHTEALETLHSFHNASARSRALAHAESRLVEGPTCHVVAYDYDELVAQAVPVGTLGNDDSSRASLGIVCSPLHFEARFESGNLRKALQVGETEYDLVLNPDVSTNFHHRWFYFEISGMRNDIDYTFNFINFERSGSLYAQGLCPLLYSVHESSLGWHRVGQDLCYFRNQYWRPSGEPLYTLSFRLRFLHQGDVCYLAYAFPYTFSLLKTHLWQWGHGCDRKSIYWEHQDLCLTPTGNSVPVVTLTAQPLEVCRPHIFLSARVHPGETNSSWIMKGVVDFLLSSKPSAQRLRETFVFKLVPMLNPDGVINGCQRCALSGEDLNRQWLAPEPQRHPSIFHAKALLQYLHSVGRSPLLVCDFHGHSRRFNVFMYGCSPLQSWRSQDRLCEDDQLYEVLPLLLHQLAPAFSFESCCFDVEQGKEATARVTAWRHLGVKLSYTLECSLAGCDQGMYAGYHMGIAQLEEAGLQFCQALGRMGLTGDNPCPQADPLYQDLATSHRKARERKPRLSSSSSSNSLKSTDEDQLCTSLETPDLPDVITA